MRLMLWFLLATLVAILSNCEAASFTSHKPLQQALSTNLVSCESNAFNDKRFLRSESNKVVLSDDSEERGSNQKLMDSLKKIRDVYLKWEKKVVDPAFQKLAKEGKTVTDVRETFQVRMMGSGRWGTPSGFKRFASLYETFVKANYPLLAK
ncbi:Secreted RxLR effector peptide protein [Phytophthora palmivora]|uniref:RxLR effector protein n=1 Tax=Phytophthora palmivora TaxID=4796 RepID=A0A2P4YC79_9STRA|nr:Secreted RxLR effector peptide protein [Phytophthora palmivora]